MELEKGEVIKRGSTRNQILTFLANGGVDLIDWKGRKTLTRILEEIEKGDIELEIEGPYIPKTSYKVHALFLYDDGGCLLETRRQEEGLEEVPKQRLFTLSETIPFDSVSPILERKVPRDPIEDVIRAAIEELGIDITREQITRHSEEWEEIEKPSSVYPWPIISRTYFLRYSVILPGSPEPRERKKRLVRDGGTVVTIEYFSRPPNEVLYWLHPI